MTHHLKSRDIIALGFMTFALFVGAGNIIFPPMVGLPVSYTHLTLPTTPYV